MNKFNEVLTNNKEKLAMYVPVVARVHGPTHPEFYEVQKEYDVIVTKLNANEDLNEQFANLRSITHNYRIPEDTCETYEAVYMMLGELDSAYTNQ